MSLQLLPVGKMSDMDIITRQEARASGYKRYFTGAPCLRGHIEERITSSGACLACAREKQNEHYARDPAASRASRYEWSAANRERHLKNHRDGAKSRYWADPEGHRAKLRQRRAENPEKWRGIEKQYRSDPIRGLAHTARVLTAGALKRHGYGKDTKTAVLLGCSFEFFRAHLERQFLPGMTWENRSLWHIDHIVPVASAKTEDEVKSLCHFTNLRPIWARDNQSKKDKLTHLL